MPPPERLPNRSREARIGCRARSCQRAEKALVVLLSSVGSQYGQTAREWPRVGAERHDVVVKTNRFTSSPDLYAREGWSAASP